MTFLATNYSDWEKIGKTGAGTVFSAVHRPFNRDVAVKKIALHFPADTPIVACLEHEAQIIKTIDHDTIIRLHEFGQDGGDFYLSMDHIDGGSFDQIFSLRPFPKEIVLSMALQMVKGLVFAHQKNICHCNLKPANVLVSKTGNVVLTDFGCGLSLAHYFNQTFLNKEENCPVYLAPEHVAYIQEQLSIRSAAIERSTFDFVNDAADFHGIDHSDIPVFSDRKHTDVSPLHGDDIPVFSDVKAAAALHDSTADDRPAIRRSGGQDVRKDIWSVGVILYRVLAGKLPFDGINPATAGPSAVSLGARPILGADPTLPDDLASVIDASLSIDPGKRPASLEPMVLALQKFLVDFGIENGEETVRRYFVDPRATLAAMEKKATDYHIRKGKEFLASGSPEKSKAHFEAAKKIVFDPSKNDRPISFAVEHAHDTMDGQSIRPLPGIAARMATSAKRVLAGKTLKTVVAVIAALLVTVAVMIFAVSTIKQSLRKGEASNADVPQGHSSMNDRPSQPAKRPTADRLSPKNSRGFNAAEAFGRPQKDTSPGPAISANADGKRNESASLNSPDSGGNLTPPSGVVMATIDPSSAYLFVDGAGVPGEELTVGKTLRTGPHLISALANGYQSYKSEVLVEKDSVVKLSIVLKKEAVANGSLHVFSNPWADLYIDGSFQGPTPTPSLILLPEGDHVLQLQRKGFKTHTESVLIKSGEEKRLQIEMEKE